MKSLIKYTLLSLTLAGALSSCKKDLQLSPISSLVSTNYFKTEADIDQAMVGVYNKLLTFPDANNLYLSEVRSSNYFITRQDAARDYFNISGFEVTSSLATLATAWSNDYALIQRANQVLGVIDGITFSSDTKKARIKSECLFLRGLGYFELAKAFGGVPLIDKVVTSDEALGYGRKSLSDVYDFIIKDFQNAATGLPDSYGATDLGRATKAAALGMLGRAYLYSAGPPLNRTGNFELAKAVLKQVLDKENVSWKFAPTYAELFKTANDNKFNVFEVQYISGGLGLGSVIPGQVIPTNMDRKITPFGAYYMTGEPSDDLLYSYEAGDIRKNLTMDTVYRTNDVPAIINAKKYFKKFLDSSAAAAILSSSDWGINFPLLRGEDVMLMYAETINETNGGPTQEAVDLVNRIRKRAGLGNVSITSKKDFSTILEQERRHEFAWEGLYWYDLIRTNRALEVMNPWLQANYGKTMTTDNYVFPIPRAEMVVKPGLYDQNQGYD